MGAIWRPTRASLRSWRSSLAHRPTSTQNRVPGAWTWSPRHQWPPSPPTPSWRLWQVGRRTCLKTRTSPSANHLQRVESCEEEVPAEEATHPPSGSLPPGEEGEEEGAEQDGGLQVPREEEG